MNIGIIGLGSIGQRHAANLREIGIDELRALRPPNKSIQDYHKRAEGKNFLEHFEIQPVMDVDDFFQDLDGVLICTPTSKHTVDLDLCTAYNVAVFVEKPVAAVRPRVPPAWFKKKILVGYHLRHDPVFKEFKTNVFYKDWQYAHIVNHEYLPNAHPWEDYTTGYAAKASLGGGVLACYSHEIDYALQMFGLPEKIACRTSYGTLNTDVEEAAILHMFYTGNRVVTCDLSFLDDLQGRSCTVTHTEGSLQWKVGEYYSEETSAGSNQAIGSTRSILNKNGVYIREMQHFLDVIRGEVPACNLHAGLNVCAVIEAAKLSSELGHEVGVDYSVLSCAYRKES